MTTQNNVASPIGSIRLYGCGGGGINIVKRYAGPLKSTTGVADIKTTYIDTSRSNLDDDPDHQNIFVLPELDGSGKVRRENHEAIAQQVPRILKDFSPADLNLVIFTASGGTGSVAGPLIISELIERNQNVVAIVIGSDESVITGMNTFNTLKSLDHISRTKGTPVVMHYTQNDRSLKRSDVDKQVMFVISSLAVLASRQNKGLDTKDVANWVNFTRTTSVPSQLALLKVYGDAKEVDQLAGESFTLAALLKSEDEEQPRFKPEYNCDGFYRPGTEMATNLFFTIETHGLRDVLNQLNAVAQNAQETKQARIDGPSFVGRNDEVSSTGLIL